MEDSRREDTHHKSGCPQARSINSSLKNSREGTQRWTEFSGNPCVSRAGKLTELPHSSEEPHLTKSVQVWAEETGGDSRLLECLLRAGGGPCPVRGHRV